MCVCEYALLLVLASCGLCFVNAPPRVCVFAVRGLDPLLYSLRGLLIKLTTEEVVYHV